jgi:hypothetical protein
LQANAATNQSKRKKKKMRKVARKFQDATLTTDDGIWRREARHTYLANKLDLAFLDTGLSSSDAPKVASFLL